MRTVHPVSSHFGCHAVLSRLAALDLIFRLLFAHDVSVPNRRCRVSFTDSEGVSHSADVTATSLYEACVLALAEFQPVRLHRRSVRSATRLCVAVQPPSTTHELSVANVHAWLDGNGRSPNQQALKVRLREVLRK